MSEKKSIRVETPTLLLPFLNCFTYILVVFILDIALIVDFLVAPIVLVLDRVLTVR